MATSPKPSLRDRLFSNTSRKNTKLDEITPMPSEEHASLSTTLTGHNRRIPFYRRKATASAGALSSASTTSHSIIKPPSSHSRSRPSFLSKFVTKVVPCVNNPSEHPPLAPLNTSDLNTLKDIPSSSKPDVSLPQEDTNKLNLETPPEFSGFALPPPSSSVPPSPTDTDIIVAPPPSATLLPEAETDGLTSGSVQPPGSSGIDHVHVSPVTPTDSDRSSESDYENHEPPVIQDEEERLIAEGGSGIPIGPDGVPKPLLPPISPKHAGRKCLVLDLDETLVHSSFKAVQQADFIVPVEIEYHWHHFHVLKRPGVDNFLKQMGELYEVVIFTASLSKYADPVLDKLDIHQVVAHRLFRESCFNHKGNYVKDLSQLGRPIADTIILDNSPASYIFHPNNAVPVSSWFNDPHDAELTDLIPFLADLTCVPDVRGILDSAR